MAYSLFFNSAAPDPRSSLCKSVTNTTPASPPTWVVGDTMPLNIYVVNGSGVYDSISGDSTVGIKLGLGLTGTTPSGGTFTITSGANTTSALVFNASASAVATALNNLASITGEGGVTVSGAFPLYQIDWNTTGTKGLCSADGGLLTPDSGATISRTHTGNGSVKERQILQLRQQPVALQTTPNFSLISNGWTGSLSLATFALMNLLGSSDSKSMYLELELTDASGNVRTYGQLGTLIRNDVIDASSLIPVPVPSYLDAATSRSQFVQNRSGITGLIGGGTTNLDGIPTAGTLANVGWLVAVTISGAMTFYQLQSGTSATSSPDIIRPTDYDGSTNQKIWRLVFTAGVGCSYSSTSASIGNTYTINPTKDSESLTKKFNVSYSGSAGTVTVNLLFDFCLAGSEIDLYFNMAAQTNSNATVEVWSGASTTKLLSFHGNYGDPDVWAVFKFNGTAWVLQASDYLE